MNAREREALDRHITGNYGEDQFPDETPVETCETCGHELLGISHGMELVMIGECVDCPECHPERN